MFKSFAKSGSSAHACACRFRSISVGLAGNSLTSGGVDWDGGTDNWWPALVASRLVELGRSDVYWLAFATSGGADWNGGTDDCWPALVASRLVELGRSGVCWPAFAASESMKHGCSAD